jgi:membrane-associated phospholipid phosphatase
MSGMHPAASTAVVAFGGYVVLTLATVAIGLVLTHVLAHGSIGHGDVALSRWLARRRDGPLDVATWIGSQIANTPAVLGIGAVATLVLAVRRLWPQLALLVVGLVVEFIAFVTTTLLVDRSRPPVRHLDSAPPTSSFPSGHTAAAVVLYVGLAIILTPRLRSRAWTILVWAVALAIPVGVALSRTYRGMHHPTDVLGGALLGAGSLVVAWYAAVVATAVAARRGERDVEHEAVTELAS